MKDLLSVTIGLDLLQPEHKSMLSPVKDMKLAAITPESSHTEANGLVLPESPSQLARRNPATGNFLPQNASTNKYIFSHRDMMSV